MTNALIKVFVVFFRSDYIGNFCSKKLSLGLVKICVQKSDSYCAFNSSLARIIQEQGREQLGISWGSAESPKCRGFTVEEFQKAYVENSQIRRSHPSSYRSIRLALLLSR